MMREVFVDTSYAIALSAHTDQYHAQALQLATQLEVERTHLVTTHAVMLEIGNALSRLRYRQDAVKLLRAIEEDPTVEVVPISEQLYTRALMLYRERVDKEWRLTDFISFIVMWDRGIMEVLTTNSHFQQAGFRVLL